MTLLIPTLVAIRMLYYQGDRVQVIDGVLVVNGEFQSEDYIMEMMLYDLDVVVVPPGHVFVLGDNRNHSYDGRYWGCLPLENVIGKMV